MAKFRKKPVTIDAITFDELVEHGKASGAPLTNGMPWSFTYNGHAITHERDDCYLIPTREGMHHMTPADMLITGVKGEIYPCKLEIFEATYDSAAAAQAPTRAPTDNDIEAAACSDFGAALAWLKTGARVARAGWNGKGQFVYLVPAASYPVQTGAAKAHFGESSLVPYNAYLALKGVDDTVSTWVPSVTDCLAEDWHVVE
ncbi:TPA: DUF2829 domain-containing protein [Burkholderia vietnamiensis]|uniref:DUF2829 domain-containing protein n=1 Tax=Burkholderia vietnamiensis TaxID=60552 RepID=UPI001ABB22A1|nr:DUF2829 domain-containing protein [Burkholderia vietnamiensis]MCA8210344.1 DUF2829 domain-containing protein [Burkholderia vietnamiensis]HDR9100043.1 DUF2829 domain-containing protein [Burkholderia vietnamiensis]HDR9117372.1 DUF2829 domain-containing protein [Burkholderia vietnamiensis]